MTLQVILPKDYFKTQVFQQYDDVGLALVRELVQNAVDAKAKRVDFSFENERLVCSDDGQGIDLEGFKSYFLTLGGSHKPDGGIGGFGAAKKLVAFAWDSWNVTSRGFQAFGSGAGEIEEIPHDSGRGFKVEASDPKLGELRLDLKARALIALSNLPGVTVTVNDEPLDKGRVLSSRQLVASTDYGDLYAVKSGHKSVEIAGRMYVRHKGLFTFSQGFVNSPYIFYLELAPGKEAKEVLAESRDKLKYHIADDLRDFIDKAPVEETHAGEMTLYGRKEAKAASPAEIEAAVMVGAMAEGKELTEAEIEAKVTAMMESGRELTEGEVDAYVDSPKAAAIEAAKKGANKSEVEAPTPLGVKATSQVIGMTWVDGESMVERVSDAMIWDYPIVISIAHGIKAKPVKDGWLTPKYRKAAYITRLALRIIAERVGGWNDVVVGLVLEDKDTLGIYGKVDGLSAICLNPDHALKSDPMAVIETVVHELAHRDASNHGQMFQAEYTRLFGLAAPVMLLAAKVIAKAQKRPMTKY